jgi:hypothetical protein
MIIVSGTGGGKSSRPESKQDDPAHGNDIEIVRE